MRLTIKPGRRAERGYVLLTLLLFVAVLAILSLGWIEKADFQIKRDREEELIHRGVQYSRAVRSFFKKFGRYPTRIEELESTNRVRFLRKRYKDPITGKDFKLLHITDVQTSFGPGAASTLPPGPSKASFAVFQAGGAGTGAPGSSTATSGATSDQQQPTDQNSDTEQGQSGPAVAPNPGGANPGLTPAGSPSASAPGSQENKSDNRVFGGGPIVGVASTSKEKSIREFNKKDHYNQWQFIYDPATDRGGLLATPNQPPLQGAVANNPQSNQQQSGNNPQGQTPGFGSAGQGPLSPQLPPQSPPQQQPFPQEQPPQQ